MARNPTDGPPGQGAAPTISPIGYGTFDPAAAMQGAGEYYQQGRLDEAAARCRQIVEIEPAHAGALHFLGIILLQQGDPEGAADSISRAAEADGQNADIHADLGVALMTAERPDEGIEAFRRATKLKPRFAEAHYNLGRALAGRGDFDGAAKSLKTAVRQQPGHADAQMNLGLVLASAGETKKSLPYLRKAVALMPGNVHALINLGTVLIEAEETDDAARQFTRALDIDQDTAAAHFGLGHARETGGTRILMAAEQEEVAGHYRRALGLEPHYYEAHNNLGNILKSLHRLDDAERHYRQALEVRPSQLETAANLAEVLIEQDRDDEAMDIFTTLRQSGLGPVYAGERIARLMQEKGAFESARDMIAELRAIDPDLPAVFTLSAAERGHQFSAQEIARAEALAHDIAVSEEDRVRLLFALARTFEASGDIDASFAHLREGNALVAKRMNHDQAAEVAFVDETIRIFSPEFFTARDQFGNDSTLPVFIVGVPRSGTTLIEQIIASHPQAEGGGELDDIPDMAISLPRLIGEKSPFPVCVEKLDAEMARRLGDGYVDRLRQLGGTAVRVTDKLPGNYAYLGLIAMLFPQARIIYCRRHPIDNCLSLYLQHFQGHHPYAYDLENLAGHYRQHERLMAHWRRVCPLPILECRYEDMVADQEAKSREIIDFLGLPWDDQCLRFFETDRKVKTASLWQVRQPMYTSAVDRWKKYEKHLAPLIEALGDDQGSS